MHSERVMTTRELANYMKLNEKTILKKAQKGELPGVQVGNQWRFNLAAIDKYLQKDIMNDTPKEELNILIETEQHVIPLSRLMSSDLMDLDLKTGTKDEVLSELAEIAYKGGVTSSKKKLLDQLMKREKMLSTATGNGIAVPHPRNPDTTLFRRPNIVMARSVKGIDFQAPDNNKVHLFFMICAPNMIVHLRLLAKISKLLHIEGVIDKFMKVSNSEEMMRVLLAMERNQLFPWELVE